MIFDKSGLIDYVIIIWCILGRSIKLDIIMEGGKFVSGIIDIVVMIIFINESLILDN